MGNRRRAVETVKGRAAFPNSPQLIPPARHCRRGQISAVSALRERSGQGTRPEL